MSEFSVLELLHPDGSASTSCVVGENCPESLFPSSKVDLASKVEVFILAPSARQCRTEGWLEGAVESMRQRLAEDGLGYVLAPLPWRQKIISLLRRAGFVLGPSFWHFPDWTTSHYLVPLERNPAQFAVEAILTAPSWKRTIARQMFRHTGARRFLAAFWKPAGISVRRPGSRPLFQWLFQREQEQALSGTAILRRSWRGARGANILYCFSEKEPLPLSIAKTSLLGRSAACPEKEAEVLTELGPAARSAGVEVPHILGQEQNDRRSSLLLSHIRGQPVSDLLESNPDLWSSILPRVVDWLERWYVATVIVQTLRMEQLWQDLLAPVDLLTPFLQGYEGYRNWLLNKSQAAAGVMMPFVSTHNDLTMVNILLDEHDGMGVVDWETGQAKSWPLVDFYYAITDAVRITAGCPNWLEAFKACYLPEGSYARNVHSWQERLRTAIWISPPLAELCFHACWLHHASNEHRSHQDGAPRPFLQIVQWLALHYSNLNGTSH